MTRTKRQSVSIISYSMTASPQQVESDNELCVCAGSFLPCSQTTTLASWMPSSSRLTSWTKIDVGNNLSRRQLESLIPFLPDSIQFSYIKDKQIGMSFNEHPSSCFSTETWISWRVCYSRSYATLHHNLINCLPVSSSVVI